MTKKRLSITRLIILLTFICILVYGIGKNVKKTELELSVAKSEPWFAPYVDVTAKPLYAFEQLGNSEVSDVILSFIVSSKDDPCLPTWGTYHTLEEARVELDLDRRIARLRQQGGNVAVSFGGALNDELSLNCTDLEKLSNAYTSVIERYQIDTIDLDLENESLKNNDASIRRAQVISQIQKTYRENQKHLAVWVTLPVAPQGLTQESTDTVAIILENGIDLAGINVMTMDYGASKDKNESMYTSSRKALIETHRQIGILYRNSGIELSDSTLWKKIGATPMIGQNDIYDEVFTIDDAHLLNEFAVENGIGRMSMWSANRDILCGENYVDVKKVSDSCSGVKNEKNTFINILGLNFNGRMSENANTKTVEENIDRTPIVDSPESSPYQIWRETGAYPKGVKVVWRGNVYEAKWWTKNNVPDNPVLQYWDTPWQLIGPVLPNETPIKQLTLPEGTYPDWSGIEIYKGGERVLFEGAPFQAKWWNQGESPAASAANPDSSPWLEISQTEIESILKEIGE